MGEDANIVEDSRSCRGEARANLKESINNVWNLPGKNKGQSSEEGPKNPAKGYNQDTFLGVDMQVLGLEIRAYST